jgi:parallel beta-helix repeat protein
LYNEEATDDLSVQDTVGTRAVLLVPGTYVTISAAVNAAAASGDTIQVSSGTYPEDIVIPSGKSVTILGAGYSTTTINAQGSGSVVSIYGDNCKIDGFTITGSRLQVGDAGIFINSSFNTITNCLITQNYQGICLNNSHNNTIENNIIERTLGPEPFFVQDHELLAHWEFEESSWSGTAGEVKDSSGNNYNGTAFNGANTVGGGVYGRCAYFGGTNDRVDFPFGNGTQPSRTPLSYTFWLRSQDLGANQACLIQSDWGSGQYRAYVGHPNNNYWRIGITSSTFTIGQSRVRADGNWHFMTFVFTTNQAVSP